MPARMTQQEFEQRVKVYTNDTVDVIGTYFNKKTKVLIKCKTCGYEWDFSPSSLMPSSANKYNFIGCPKCKYTKLTCDYCGKEIFIKRCELNALTNGVSHHKFCSKDCANKGLNTSVINISSLSKEILSTILPSVNLKEPP